ncbi:MAG: hypothetical protein IT460_09345 [Planctomycetes bacterium]|nr:hypothetical protein [Planctomycetota bacterium]
MTASRAARALVAVALAVLGTACMQNETKTTILADGSGTCTDTITIDIEKTRQLLETAKMFGVGGPGGPGGPGAPQLPDDLDVEKMLEGSFGEATLKAELAATPGVSVKSVSSEVKNGKRVAKREFAFSGFDALGRAAFRTMTAELRKNDDGSWTLDMDAMGPMRGMLGGGANGAQGGFGGFDAGAMMGMMADLLGDFGSKATFTFPGTVTETNGTKGEDGKSVTWSFSVEDLKKASSDPTKAPGRMTATFKGEGLMLKPFKYSPSLGELMKQNAPKPAAPSTPTEPAKPAEPVKPTEPAPTK